MKIAGNIAVVTGAGAGLGLATAKRLADAGAQVVALDICNDRLRRIEAGPSMMRIAADVTDGGQIEAAFAQVREQLGTPRILVNCAGVLGSARIFRIDAASGKAQPRPLDVFRKVIEINLVGTFNTVRCFAAGLSKLPLPDDDDHGVIINTASIAAYEAISAQTAYSSSKAGVASMTLPLARELARYGIRVAALAPGVFATEMYQAIPAATRESIVEDIPYPRRPGHVDEFAHMALALAENRMMNGSVVRIDGAARMREPAARHPA